MNIFDSSGKPLRSPKKVGRNDPCPCGSKKPDGTPNKTKNCCGDDVGSIRTYLFDHPIFTDTKDTKATSLKNATRSFKAWWDNEVKEGRLSAGVKFEAARIMPDPDEAELVCEKLPEDEEVWEPDDDDGAPLAETGNDEDRGFDYKIPHPDTAENDLGAAFPDEEDVP